MFSLKKYILYFEKQLLIEILKENQNFSPKRQKYYTKNRSFP